jgi:predicted pyridoxine 5'-phosphate oxidase superfamily flavin-nucleotide-binding protein
MSALYGEHHRALQSLFEARPLADRLVELIVSSEIPDQHKSFIESRDFFFLSTVDHRGYPTCSHKGGHPGFVRVLDPHSLAFPIYDGNGMFLSTGNISGQGKIGMLFIDFETPHRVRVHGTATVSHDDPMMATFAGAELLVRVRVEEIFVNCPRYIHTYRRIAPSRYGPSADCPVRPPQWKRIDAVQAALPPRDRDAARSLGGVISAEQYGEKVIKGEG